MEWSLTKAEESIPLVDVDSALDEHLKQNLVMTTLEDMLAWGRKNSIWPFNFGLSCCYVEMAPHSPAGLMLRVSALKLFALRRGKPT